MSANQVLGENERRKLNMLTSQDNTLEKPKKNLNLLGNPFGR